MKKLFYSFAILFCTTGLAVKGQDNDLKAVSLPVISSSQEAMANFKLGLALFDLGEGKKATAYFRKTIELDPKCVIAYLYLGLTDFSLKSFTNNLKKAQDNLSTASEWEKLYYQILQSFTVVNSAQRFEAAQKLVSAYPNLARSYIELGFAYDQKKDYKSARLNFEKAIELDPVWVGGYDALANSYLWAEPKDPDLAEKYAKQLQELAPDHPGPYVLLGNCYRAKNDLQKAAELYSRALDMDKEFQDAYYKRGDVSALQGKYDDARKDYEQGAQFDQNPSNGLYNVALTYLFEGNRKRAMQFLQEKAATLNVLNDASKTIAAKTWFLSGASDIAFHENDLNALEPIVGQLNPVMTQYLGELGTQEAKVFQKASLLYTDAMVKMLKRDYKGALANAEAIRKIQQPLKDPNVMDGYYDLIGQIHLRQKMYKEAIKDFEKGSKLSIMNKYRRAKAYEGVGQTSQARKLYQEIIASNATDLEYALVINEVKQKVHAR